MPVPAGFVTGRLRAARGGGLVRKKRRRDARGRIPGLPFGLAVASALLPGMAARAQDALRTNLALDQSTAAPTYAGQNAFASVKLGPFLGHLSLYGTATYNDNINATETDIKSDAILTIGLTSSFIAPIGQRSQLSLDLGVGYSTYLQHTEDSTLDISPDSALSYNISFPNGYLTLFDGLSYTSQVYNEGALANIEQLPRWSNTVGTRVTWSPNRWLAQAGYSYNNIWSTGSSNSYLNWATQDLFLRTGWMFAQDTQAGLEASAGYTSYGNGSEGNTTSYSLGAYTDWQITKFIHAEVHGGPAFYQLGAQNGAPARELSSYYVDGTISDQLTEHINQSLLVQRNVQLGLNLDSQYIEDFVATYSVNWSATSRIICGLNVGYEDGNQPLPVQGDLVIISGSGISVEPITLDENEHFRRYGGGASLTWLESDHFSVSVNYSYWERFSNLPDRNYVDNSVTLNAGYNF